MVNNCQYDIVNTTAHLNFYIGYCDYNPISYSPAGLM